MTDGDTVSVEAVSVQFFGTEAAAEAGVSEGAIRVRMHRAMQDLKSIMDALQETDR